MSCKSSNSLRRTFWFVAVSLSRWCRSLSRYRRLCQWWCVRGAAAAAGSFVRLVPAVLSLRRFVADDLQDVPRPPPGSPRPGPPVVRGKSHDCGSCGPRRGTLIP